MLSTIPNAALKILKWPVAFVAVAAFPGAILASWALLQTLIGEPDPLLGFATGAVGYLVCWWLIFKRRFAGSFFSTAEHEFTHALFAWMTLHWVIGFRATWNSGGEVSYEGEGNWLITIAPYWFPTLTLPFIGVMIFSDSPNGSWPTIGLGAAFVYHVTSTWRETHSEQTDLHKTGFSFAWMFLPTANILTYAGLLAYAHGGPEAVLGFLNAVLDQSRELWTMTGVEELFS